MRASEGRLAAALVAPALGSIALVALFPLLWTFWESLHLHDLRSPWLGRPFVGLANYVEALGDPRLLLAIAHTGFFAASTLVLELLLGLGLALGLRRAWVGLGVARTVALIPWALPTVVAALIWRFLFDGPGSPANLVLEALGRDASGSWLAHPRLAWVPVLLADVWKTTPFVALLLLAGLQSIDPSLYEAARVDGASRWQQFRFVTLPLLRPAILVAVTFRTLDALRVFDLVYALTGGGPGTATEPLALYTFTVLLQHLRFGYGSALGLIAFLLGFSLALVYVRLLGSDLTRDPE